MARNVGDGVFITAIPDGDGLLRLDSSFNLSLWKPWRTNTVVAGVAVDLVVSEREPVRYFRVASP